MRQGIRHRFGGMCLAAVMLAVAVTPVSSAVQEVAAADDDRCNYDSPVSVRRTANDLMNDRYRLGQHRVVTLPHRLTWREDPLRDRQWRQKFHQLRYVMALMYQTRVTGQPRYRQRAMALVRSWIAANPRGAAASDSAWKDQVTAWRAMTLVCIARMGKRKAWLNQAIARHGAALADPGFYVVVGNHALNQALGLLDVGCYLGRTDWQRLARSRLARYAMASIDSQGVSNEQAIKYDAYVYQRLMPARERLRACGLTVPSGLARVDRIPSFLAQATRPDGHLETIGDSDDVASRVIRGTDSEFTASLGARGTAPARTIALYRRGYAFGRTGWGDCVRAFQDEMFFSLRFGPGLRLHGHDDAGALTYYGNGSQLLVDPGYGDQNSSRWHRYFVSRAAHDAVVAYGLVSRSSAASELRHSRITARAADLLVKIRNYPGVTMRRRVIFSRRLGYLVVEDTMSSAVARRYGQLWHLTEESRPFRAGRRTWTRNDHGNVLIQQLVGSGSSRMHRGETSPIQGWVSRHYGHRAVAPVIEYSASGRQVRFLTLIASFGDGTGKDQPPARASRVVVNRNGYSMDVVVDGVREHVRATAAGVRITDG